MPYDVMAYDVMAYDVLKYDFMTYGIIKYDIMTYDVMKYDIMTYAVMKYEVICHEMWTHEIWHHVIKIDVLKYENEENLILKTVPGLSLHNLSCACFLIQRDFKTNIRYILWTEGWLIILHPEERCINFQILGRNLVQTYFTFLLQKDIMILLIRHFPFT